MQRQNILEYISNSNLIIVTIYLKLRVQKFQKQSGLVRSENSRKRILYQTEYVKDYLGKLSDIHHHSVVGMKYYPNLWKTTKIVLILEPGKDPLAHYHIKNNSNIDSQKNK